MNDPKHQAQELMESLQGQPNVVEFAEWCEKNMPHKALRDQAAATVSGLIGHLIGAWFDAGADKETVQEYFRRFIEVGWEQFSSSIVDVGAPAKEPPAEGN